MFIGRTDAETETPILWPPDAKKLTHLKRSWSNLGTEPAPLMAPGRELFTTSATWEAQSESAHHLWLPLGYCSASGSFVYGIPKWKCPSPLTPVGYCSASGSFVYGISQARVLECVASPFSRGSSWPRDQTQVSCIAGRFFTVWTTTEAQLYVGTHGYS